VQLFQEALGQSGADGYFGPGTHAALIDVQRRLGVPVTGVLDAATWAALGVTADAPFPDLNGDGVIDGSELPAG
jgi:peptidoglycan hydrolase-like protein with peptidoglycan-binding domain